MKKTIYTAILPKLPIVGILRLTSYDGKSLALIEIMTKNSKASDLSPFFTKCYKEFEGFLSGQKNDIKIKLDYSSLSPFQLKVLFEMKKIPYGKVESYKDLAIRMNSKGYQAIGSACGKNPFMLIHPCHRVVGSQDLGGFAHGLKMKKQLLKLEGLKSDFSNNSLNLQ
jgi:O-6-methylguanine DNA methyltransferase